MHLTSDFQKDFRREKKKSGSYEWWYFDAYDKVNNLHFVIIFYDGCPFSPEYIDRWENPETRNAALASEHPAVSISVYKDEKPIFYSLCEYKNTDLIWNGQKSSLQIGSCSFEMQDRNDKLVYFLNLDETLPGGDKILASLKFEGNKPPVNLLGPVPPDTGMPHEWNLCLPGADVTGSLVITGTIYPEMHFDVKARGYHDHNIGFEPMKLEFINWYWGRLHSDSGTILFYVMKKKDGIECNAWLISPDNSGIEFELKEVSLQDIRSNIFMLKSARKIELKGINVEIMIQMSKIVDSGPFYYRYLCDGILKSDTEGIIDVAHGISEYIQPARIHSKLFRPLVNMRYRYAGRKPHWVQKNPYLYRLTW